MHDSLVKQVPSLALCKELQTVGFPEFKTHPTFFAWDMKRLAIEFFQKPMPVVHLSFDDDDRLLSTVCCHTGTYIQPTAQLLPAPSVAEMLQLLPGYFPIEEDFSHVPASLKKIEFKDTGAPSLYRFGNIEGTYLPDVLAQALIVCLKQNLITF
jgi:hypothetical protein